MTESGFGLTYDLHGSTNFNEVITVFRWKKELCYKRRVYAFVCYVQRFFSMETAGITLNLKVFKLFISVIV